jgi:hypothetical protein
MPFQTVPSGVQVKLIGQLGDQPCINVFNIDVAHEVTEVDVENCAIAVDAWFQAELLPHVSDDYTLIKVVGTDLEHDPAIQHEVVHSPALAGSITSGGMPANSALVTSLRTANIGRSYRGRSYLGGLPIDSQVSVDAMDTGYAATVATGYIALVDALHSLGYALAVLSRIAGGVLRVAGLLTEIIAVVTNTRIDTQRRRVNN